MRWDSDTQPEMFEGRRYDPATLLNFFLLIRSRHPNLSIHVVTDMDLPGFDVPVWDCRKVDFRAHFVAETIAGSVFYCIFDSDENAAIVIGYIADCGGIFYPAPIYDPPASYFHFHDNARRVLKQELDAQRREGFDKWDCGPGDMINLIQCIDLTREVQGAFVEVGTYRGSSARLALRYMQSIGLCRVCWFLDVFTGFNYEEATRSADRGWVGTHATEGLETVAKRLLAYNNPDAGLDVKVVQSNVIRDPLPADLTEVALANIDVDMLEAVQAALFRIAPLVVRNGILIVEDPGHTPALIGARIALNRFLNSPAADGFLPLYMESGQTLLIRNR